MSLHTARRLTLSSFPVFILGLIARTTTLNAASDMRRPAHSSTEAEYPALCSAREMSVIRLDVTEHTVQYCGHVRPNIVYANRGVLDAVYGESLLE